MDDKKTSIFDFLWDGKPDKIKRKQLIQPVELGGLQLTDIYSFINSIEYSWVKRIIDTTNKSKWALFCQNTLAKYGGSLIFECNISESIILDIAKENMFLSNILSSWSHVTNM